MTLAASLDLGTNTFRLLIADATRDGARAPLHTERVITRLGEGFHRSGAISNDAASRSLAALQTFCRIISGAGVSRVFPVATSVVREASNGRHFITRVEEVTGLSVRVLSGIEEAVITHAGVLATITPPAHCVVVDIGGGSTELILSRGGIPLTTSSIPLGVVHLAEKLLPSDPPAPSELQSLRSFIQASLASSLAPAVSTFPSPALRPHQATPLVGTAGSITTLAAIDQSLPEYHPARVNNYCLSRRSVSAIFNRLVSLKRDRRSRITGMEHGREDLIIPGAAILLEIMNYFQAEELTVSDGGLLEGILIDARHRHLLL